MNKHKNDGNDTDDVDYLLNYKGEFYNSQIEKYQDLVTGAHFRYTDLCKRLESLKKTISRNKKFKTINYPIQPVRVEKVKIATGKPKVVFLNMKNKTQDTQLKAKMSLIKTVISQRPKTKKNDKQHFDFGNCKMGGNSTQMKRRVKNNKQIAMRKSVSPDLNIFSKPRTTRVTAYLSLVNQK